MLSILQVLSEKKVGIVAHFYMDPQVQGVLTSAAERWPHIHISDSLVMADRAVKMVEEGCTTVAVLGVDFMSENVRAILDEAGHKDTKVSSHTTVGASHVCLMSDLWYLLCQVTPMLLALLWYLQVCMFCADHAAHYSSSAA